MAEGYWSIGDSIGDTHDGISQLPAVKVVEKAIGIRLKASQLALDLLLTQALDHGFHGINKLAYIVGEGLNGYQVAWSWDDCMLYFAEVELHSKIPRPTKKAETAT